jgi:hypothetical protein
MLEEALVFLVNVRFQQTVQCLTTDNAITLWDRKQDILRQADGNVMLQIWLSMYQLFSPRTILHASDIYSPLYSRDII